ncbi:MAG: acVLRF1 family peptidyl-tRNA hydrolase [Dehalococcoidia bacterium]
MSKTHEPAVTDRSRGALLRLLDRLDTLSEREARTFYLPPPAVTEGLGPELTAAVERLPAATGIIAFWGPSAQVAVAPPFPVPAPMTSSGYDTAPLRDLLNRPRTLAVILVRLGGYSMGIYRDGAFTETKTGGRFVKNRHRKGGQSQRRFERIREGQIREHFDAAGEAVRAKLLPHAAELDAVVLGGDRRTVQAWLARSSLPDMLAAKVLPRVIDVPEPRLDILQRTPAAIWTSRVIILSEPPPDATASGSVSPHFSPP